MIVFNINLEAMRIHLPTVQIFYFYEDESKIDIYLPKENCFLKATYNKVGDENDLIFKSDFLNMRNGLRILDIEKREIDIKISGS